MVFRYTDDNNYYVLFLKNNDKTGRKMELSISIYKDGNLEISTTDSALASGKIGARVYANTKAIFDDISVTC
ncbi:hypothetical protein GCM10008018_63110 [Paenibacillus marchantiophytorum]|uniref:Uncharacterized protein n=1 Tax=Paenibacillus marchantiophytorum TaxID=1619310 RepID=A0ABQ1FEI6_9BACL|nr:hypothetical protein [Paenibacillus marchantiophytorum]GGA08868.1 hypothetical protein GCM10008018_63110 [Paenibacillus marchantiophytorum]